MKLKVEGKKVAVIGLGNSGVNAALLLGQMRADVWATDSNNSLSLQQSATTLKNKGIHVETGRHTRDFISGCEFVVISPGVDERSDAVVWAKEERIPIISEMELGYRFCRGKIIAVTGTNGKTTVTTLIGKMLKDAGFDTIVCGNIGNSLCGEVGRIKDGTWVVLEVSSFQLDRIDEFRPHIALILNITDDHQDRYKEFKDYYNSKLKVFSNQKASDFLILNYDAPNIRDAGVSAQSKVLYYSARERTNGTYVLDNSITSVCCGKEEPIGPISSIRLKGAHNIENVLACALAAKIAEVPANSIIKSISDFSGLPHRVESVGFIDGVEYVDDSKGTTVDSTRRAIECSGKKVILIAGGRDKNSNFKAIGDIVKEKVSSIILIGEAKEKIRAALGSFAKTFDAETLEEAVGMARKIAEKGDMVLLSPMCASFDMFRDYKHRGDCFKEAVRSLKENKSKVNK